MKSSCRSALAFLVHSLLVVGATVAQSEPPRPAAEVAATAEAKTVARTLHGTVSDPEQRPLAGATVRLIQSNLTLMDPDLAAWVEPLIVQTDAEGRFSAPGLERKAYLFRVEAGGFAATGGTVEPDKDSLEVILKKGHTLQGRVAHAQTQKPLAGAKVLACDENALVFGEQACAGAATGEGGSFRMEHLPEGKLALQARAAGHAVSDIQNVVLPREEGTKDLAFYLRPGARLAGKVVDGKGKPVPRRVVLFQPQHDSVRAAKRQGESWPVVSDLEGRFVHEGLAAGLRYTLNVKRPKDRPPAEAGPVEIQAGRNVEDFEIVLRDASTVLVRLVNRDEVAVESVEVFVRQPDQEPNPFGQAGAAVTSESIVKGGEGRFTLEIFEEGRRSLLFLPAGYAEIDRPNVSLKPGATVDLGTLTVEEGPAIAGQVTNLEGAPVADAEIGAFYTTPAGMRTRKTRSGESGAYRLGGLGEAPVMFMNVSAKGYGGKTRQNVAPGDEPVDFVLEPSGGVRGSVALSGGGAPEAFTVQLHAQATGGIDIAAMMSGMTNQPKPFSTKDGSFEMLDISPGRYTVEARAVGQAPGRKQGVEVTPRETTDTGTIVLADGIDVRGRIVSESDDHPILGAGVLAQEKSGSLSSMMQRLMERGGDVVSDEDGRFELTGLAPGSYTLTIEHPDYAEALETLELAEDAAPEDLLVRLKSGGGLTGTVRGPGGPVKDSRVIVFQNMFEMDRARTAVTDAEGRYELTRVPAGSYQVMRAPGEGGGSILNMKTKTAVIRDGEVTVVDLGDDARIMLRGNVLRGTKNLGEASLTFMPSGGGTFTDIRAARSDASGRYQMGLDQPGTYRVAIQAGAATFGGFEGTSIEIVVPDEPEVTRDLVIRASGAAGKVTDEKGGPLVRATVSAIRDGATEDPWAQSGAMTDAEGHYALEGLEDGNYRITASADGFRSASAYPVEIGGGSMKEGVDLQLTSGTMLRGVLLDPRGGGIQGAFVLAAPAGTIGTQGIGQAMTDVNGAFAVTAPSDGTVDLTAVAQGWAPARRLAVPVETGAADEQIVLHADLGGRLQVRVLDAAEQPVSGVNLQIRPVVPYLGSELMQLLSPPQPTDPSGATLAANLASGDYTVAVVGRTNVPPARATIVSGADTSLVVRLP